VSGEDNLRIVLNRRGQARIFEAVIAIMILFPFATYMQSYRPPGEYQNPDLYRMGVKVFVSLDRKGTLSQTVTAGDWMRLREAIKGCLPSDVSFVLTAYNVTWSGSPMSLSLTEVPNSRIGYGSYVLSGRATISYTVNIVTDTGLLQSYILSLTLMRG
jgi:hypothetical protein